MKKWLLLAIAPYLLFPISGYGEGEWQVLVSLCGFCSSAIATFHYDKTFDASQHIKNKTLRELFLAPYSIWAIILYPIGAIPPPTHLTL